MKTAISIPTELFENAERLAIRLQTTRSQLYAKALAEFIARHDQSLLTETMNQALDEIEFEPQTKSFIAKANQMTLERNEW
jgi:metal-responsive CopG/Arc/MetJ family transcriptional regulator